jgi:hypothetical protein
LKGFIKSLRLLAIRFRRTLWLLKVAQATSNVNRVEYPFLKSIRYKVGPKTNEAGSSGVACVWKYGRWCVF